MISGIVLLSGWYLAATPSPSVPPVELAPATSALIAGLRRPAPSDTAYSEVRFLRMLHKPLVLRGELHYGGGGELGKRVDEPYRESTTIADGEVAVQRDGKPVKRFSLERAPELQALLASFSALLGGDPATLNEHYVIAAQQADAAQPHSSWRLVLTPRAPALTKHLHDLTVDGAGSEPRCFTLHEADGDASTMLLGELAASPLASAPTPAALDSLCRGAAP